MILIQFLLYFVGLVNILKDEIKYIHAFVISFKQTDNRMTASLRSMIGLFQKMFGDQFWKNAILGIKILIILLTALMNLAIHCFIIPISTGLIQI